MSKIRILSDHEARKIAAGEVVERPASVVKELLENALDAQATSMTLVVNNGGKSRIEIRDNGCGMSPEDARLCTVHHATSKLEFVSQLPYVTTFGFRGEALASIAGVSKFQIITRRSEDDIGTQISIEGGIVISEEAVGANIGTTIIVDDLFFNVPARKKFMKQRDTEWRAIHQLVCATALAFPHICITVFHDGQQLVTARACTTLLERAEQLFGRDVSPHLIPLIESPDIAPLQVQGIITTHQYGRYDRRNVFCFVNRRWVKNYIFSKALLAGYNNVLSPNKFPVAVLLMTVPAEEVDVNIHPRKEEVMLLHPQLVSDALQQLVNKTLHTHIGDQFIPVKQMEYQKLSRYTTPHASQFAQDIVHTTSLYQEAKVPLKQSTMDVDLERVVDTKTEPAVVLPAGPTITHRASIRDEEDHSEYEKKIVPETTVHHEMVAPDLHKVKQEVIENNLSIETTPVYELIGQFASTYILIEVSAGLLLVDQHAAHECIIYQRLVKKSDDLIATKLLFPEFISMSSDDIKRIEPHLEMLRQLGIEAEVWGERQIIITATSTLLHAQSHNEIIVELLKKVDSLSTTTLYDETLHRLRSLIACKAAVKAGDILSVQEQHGLIAAYLSTEKRLSCPHGRPTSWLLSHHEFERKFKRITS